MTRRTVKMGEVLLTGIDRWAQVRCCCGLFPRRPRDRDFRACGDPSLAAKVYHCDLQIDFALVATLSGKYLCTIS